MRLQLQGKLHLQGALPKMGSSVGSTFTLNAPACRGVEPGGIKRYFDILRIRVEAEPHVL